MDLGEKSWEDDEEMDLEKVNLEEVLEGIDNEWMNNGRDDVREYAN